MDPIKTNIISNVNREASRQVLSSFRQAVREASDRLQQPQNTTYSLNSRKDRIKPPSEEEAKRAVLPKDTEKTLEGSPHLSTVQSGTFKINDVAIAIDPSVDSLKEIVHKINSSSAGVQARFDFETNQLEIKSVKGNQFDLHSDSSNLLRELNVLEGSYNGSTDRPDVNTIGSAFPSSEIIQEINSVIKSVNAFLSNQSLDEETKSEIVSSLKSFIVNETGSKPQVPGVDFDSNSIYFRFNQDGLTGVEINTDRLFEQISKNPKQFKRFFSSQFGLEDTLESKITSQIKAQESESADLGSIVDTEDKMIRCDEEANLILNNLLEEIKYFRAEKVISLYRNYYLNRRFHDLLVDVEK